MRLATYVAGNNTTLICRWLCKPCVSESMKRSLNQDSERVFGVCVPYHQQDFHLELSLKASLIKNYLDSRERNVIHNSHKFNSTLHNHYAVKWSPIAWTS